MKDFATTAALFLVACAVGIALAVVIAGNW